jgi:hypothetical protein
MKDTSPPTRRITRRHERLPVNVSVRVFRDNAQVALGRGHDIGTGGMAVYVPLELAVGTLLDITFQLPYSRTVFGIRSIVRNNDGFRYGLEFTDLTPTESKEIDRVTSILKLTA